MHRETAETADLDALAVGQGVSYVLQQPLDRRLDILLWHVVVSTGESFDELRLVIPQFLAGRMDRE